MTRFNALWISDVHLGTPACRAHDLLQFLRGVEADRIYLVGDIVDLLHMRGRISLPQTHQDVISRFTELAAEGVEVLYIPGNHDHVARDFVNREILGVPIRFECEHTTADGRRLLITHGDILDREIRRDTNLEAFGAAAYGLLLQLDVAINRRRSRLGKDYLPVSQRVKGRIASAREYIDRFEAVAAAHAERNGFDGIVCGHIHKPAVRQIGNVLYANDGDWVEHRTAVGETPDGELVLLRYSSGAVDIERETSAEEPAEPIAA